MARGVSCAGRVKPSRGLNRVVLGELIEEDETGGRMDLVRTHGLADGSARLRKGEVIDVNQCRNDGRALEAKGK